MFVYDVAALCSHMRVRLIIKRYEKKTTEEKQNRPSRDFEPKLTQIVFCVLDAVAFSRNATETKREIVPKLFCVPASILAFDRFVCIARIARSTGQGKCYWQ